MAKIAGVDVSGIIAKEVGAVLSDSNFDAILIKVEAGTRTAGNLAGGNNPTDDPKTCKGFIDQKRRDRIGGTLVEDGDVIIVLLGDTIQDAAVPEVNDKVTLEGTTYRIRGLDRDPAAATYSLLCQ